MMLETDDDSGLAIWCNNCQDFPDTYNLKAYSDGHTVLKCIDCGETEVIGD